MDLKKAWAALEQKCVQRLDIADNLKRIALLVIASLQFQSLLANAQNLNPRPLIPEILILKDGEELPSSVFDHYDTRTIAESLVWRISKMQNSEPPDALRGERDINFRDLGKVEVYIHFKSKNLESILSNGYLNQYQIGRSTAVYMPEARSSAEDELMHLKLGNVERKYIDGDKPEILESLDPHTLKVRELRAKYGALDYENIIGTRIVNEAPNYGDMALVLSDEAKRRVTITPGDSLIGHIDRLKEAFTFFNSFLRINPREEWTEAQVWGPIELIDIKELLIPEKLSSKDMRLLLKTGVPLYHYRTTVDGDCAACLRKVKTELINKKGETQ